MPDSPAVPSTTNRLLAALPRGELERLEPHLTWMPLAVGQVLLERGQPIRNVYFINSGVCSFTTVMNDGSMVEVATIGFEGMVGLRAYFGQEPALSQSFIQVAGLDSSALRLPVDVFRREVARSGALDAVMRRYTQAFFASMMHCIACNALHSVSQRCARWLLMTHDRVHQNEFGLSQEFLAVMLGVRRASVSKVAAEFRRKGIIGYTHGRVRVQHRRRLEAASCECYASIRREFDALDL